jgi:hypothetical protein
VHDVVVQSDASSSKVSLQISKLCKSDEPKKSENGNENLPPDLNSSLKPQEPAHDLFSPSAKITTEEIAPVIASPESELKSVVPGPLELKIEAAKE